MNGLGRVYSRAVHEETAWWGTFPPILPLQVGDYLDFESSGSIVRLGSTYDWPGWRASLPDETVNLDGSETYSYGATRNRVASAGAGASAGGVALTAGVQLDFTHEAGFVLDYVGAKWQRYRNVDAAKEWVLGLAKTGQWPADQVLVTEVLVADSATVVASRERASGVKLEVGVEIPSTAPINLADPELKLTASTTSGAAIVSLCASSTPLYHCVRVSKDWLGRWNARLLAADAPDDLTDAFEEAPFDDV